MYLDISESVVLQPLPAIHQSRNKRQWLSQPSNRRFFPFFSVVWRILRFHASIRELSSLSRVWWDILFYSFYLRSIWPERIRPCVYPHHGSASFRSICGVAHPLIPPHLLPLYPPLTPSPLLIQLYQRQQRNLQSPSNFHDGLPNHENHKNGSVWSVTTLIQNTAEICQKYFQSFIATEIFSQHFFQILRNISSQHYNFNFLKYFWKQINIQ